MALKMFFKEITSESLGIRGNYEKTAGSATIKKKNNCPKRQIPFITIVFHSF